MRSRRRFFVLVAAVLVAATAATAATLASGDASARSSGGTVRLVAYSTPREAYAKLIPAFQDTSSGQGTSFEQSYGASGEQARAVIAGLKADVVAFSLEPDMTQLVKAGLVAKTWKKNQFGGMVTRSVVVFAVRKGNPKKIKTWGDLIKPGVDVVTPNVQTSGGAKWNVMGAYGAQRKLGKSHQQSVDYLKKLYDHVVSQDKSAREALQTFLAGRGDVLIAYENEAIFAQKKNQPLEYVVPKATISIENPRRRQEQQGEGLGQCLPPLPPHGEGTADLRRERLPARGAEGCEEVRLPGPATPVHDQVAWRLGEGRQAVLRLSQRDRDQDPAQAGRLI